MMKELKEAVSPFLRQLIDRMGGVTPTKPEKFLSTVHIHVEQLAAEKKLQGLDAKFKTRFKDWFEDLPHTDDLPTNVYHRVKLKDTNKIIACRSYACPRKYKSAWDTLIQQHLDASQIRPSNSPYLSPAFIVPKSDPTVLPQWVNDYRLINANTVMDTYPLPRVDDILADCAKGKIWGKIDMTNLFFQTRMHLDDIQYTAVMTPRGAFKWLVMPMGFKNSPPTHQQRMNRALRHLIGKICHVYLDDIIIWSQTIEEHERNVNTVLLALRDTHLLCSPKKTLLFCTEIDFLVGFGTGIPRVRNS
jgi:hypothetical protein